jgi:hypothetical protein
MRSTRRQLLQWGLGAGQLALLDRFNLLSGRASAQTASDAPTKLVTLYISGGYRPQFMWWGQDDAAVDTSVPPPASYAGEPVFFNASELVDLAPANGNYKPLRTWRSWDPANPANRTGRFSPMFYGWQHYALHEQTSVLHGIDQGTNAHQSGYIAAMCGVAGSDYRAPAIQSVLANHLYERFKGTRPLPCVAISGNGLPVATGLPSHAAPILVPSIDALRPSLSAKSIDNWWWKDLETRTATPELDFRGMPTGSSLQATALEAFTFEQARAFKGRSTARVDQFLEGLHGTLTSVSRALAANVTDVLEGLKGVDYIKTNRPAYMSSYFMNPFTYTFGLANFHQTQLEPPLEMTLRLLKSDLTSAIHTVLPSPYFDTHNGSYGVHFSCAHGRAAMDCVARFLGEMKNTPAPGKPGKSLLDDTLVLIFSEFARSWPSGTSQSAAASWQYPDDHHPFTSVTFVGGGVAANRQIGSYTVPLGGGVPVDLIEENGQPGKRIPRAADMTTTALRILGLGFPDFFIPGGYGEVVGIRKT